MHHVSDKALNSNESVPQNYHSFSIYYWLMAYLFMTKNNASTFGDSIYTNFNSFYQKL